MLTDIPPCVFMSGIAPWISLKDMIRLGCASKTMDIITKEAVQKIVLKDRDLRELAESAAYEVVKHTGLPIDFTWEVSDLEKKKPVLIKYIGRQWTSPGNLQHIAPFSEIDIWDGVVTVGSGFAHKFPGQKEEVKVIFRFMLPRQESISGRGCYSIASMDGLFLSQVGNMNAKDSLDDDDGVTFDEAMDEWCYYAEFWKDKREDAGWGSASDDDCNDEFGMEDINDDDECIKGEHAEDDEHGVNTRITFIDISNDTLDCILLGDDDCMIIEGA